MIWPPYYLQCDRSPEFSCSKFQNEDCLGTNELWRVFFFKFYSLTYFIVTTIKRIYLRWVVIIQYASYVLLIIVAHSHLMACKTKLIARKSYIVDLRKQLGECLYTIQSFYSNTNWVEMFGRTPYYDFGKQERWIKFLFMVRVIEEGFRDSIL